MSRRIDRRAALKLIAGTAAVGLAGCGRQQGDDGTPTDDSGGTETTNGDGGKTRGGGDGTGQQHGERVPTIILATRTDLARADQFIQWLEVFQEDLAQIGITAEAITNQANTIVTNQIQDKRVFHGAQWTNGAVADPDVYLRFFTARTGATRFPGWVDWSQWINCDYESAYLAQKQATSPDERRAAVHDAISAMSNDKIHLTQSSLIAYGAWQKDLVEIGGRGNYGLFYNPWVYRKSRHRDGDVLASNLTPEILSSTNPENITGGGTGIIGTTIYSPLVGFNENDEFIDVLTESHEISNDGQTVAFTLKEGLTFHDGQPLTTEDVKFTFGLHRDNPEWSKVLMDWTLVESMTTIDDRQFELNWTEPNLATLRVSLPALDILPKHVWEAATDNPVEFEPDPPVGSGPFEVINFNSENFLHLQPYDGHPNPAQNELLLQSYKDETTSIQAFKQGEINILGGLSFGGYENIEGSMSADTVGLDSTSTTGVNYYLMQCHLSPIKFPEFRDAMGTVMNRELMMQISSGGLNDPEMHSTMFMKNNPWRPPDDMLHQFTDDPGGDVDAAREKLSAEGWTWDDDDNLRYPVDADVTPLWPQGENPAEEQFPCISVGDDGYTVQV